MSHGGSGEDGGRGPDGTRRLAVRGLAGAEPYGNERIAFGGVLLPMVVYPAFGPSVFVAGLGLSLIATVVASFYPAWFASKTDPAAALRVDR